MDSEQGTRRSQKNQNNGGNKGWLVLILLLLVINTAGISVLAYQSFQKPSVVKNEQNGITKIEKQLEKLIAEKNPPVISQEQASQESSTKDEGQEVTSESKQEETTTSTSQDRQGTKTHVVVDGDSLSLLATEYNVTYEKILELNNLTDNMIVIGQEIIVSE